MLAFDRSIGVVERCNLLMFQSSEKGRKEGFIAVGVGVGRITEAPSSTLLINGGNFNVDLYL
jgi:hypothetical protein